MGLENERYRIFKECGFEHITEYTHGFSVWGKEESTTFLFAKPYGSFSHFSIVIADTFDKAIVIHDSLDSVEFKVKNEYQIKIILMTLCE